MSLCVAHRLPPESWAAATRAPLLIQDTAQCDRNPISRDDECAGVFHETAEGVCRLRPHSSALKIRPARLEFLRILTLRIVWNTRQAVVKPNVLFQDIPGGEIAVDGELGQI